MLTSMGKIPTCESEVESRCDCRLHGRITDWAIRTLLRTLYLAANRHSWRSKEKRKVGIAPASILCREHSPGRTDNDKDKQIDTMVLDVSSTSQASDAF